MSVEMSLTVYLVMAAVFAVTVGVLADRLDDPETPAASDQGVLITGAAMLWPVLLVGLAQLAVIAGGAELARSGRAARGPQWPRATQSS